MEESMTCCVVWIAPLLLGAAVAAEPSLHTFPGAAPNAVVLRDTTSGALRDSPAPQGPLPAQPQFDELRKRGLPAGRDDTHAVALGDVDGDGDLDLVSGNAGQQNRLYLNDGNGIYIDVTATRMPTDNDSTLAVGLCDVDGDRDLDIVFGNRGSNGVCSWICYYFGKQNRLYLNDGTGTFTDATATHMPADSDVTQAVALGDVDGDGDCDMVFGNLGQERLYLNDGAGTFTDATAARMPGDSDNTHAVALGDLDGDGDLDAVFGNDSYFYGNRNRLYLNDGNGNYTDATAGRMPADNDDTNAVALADVDADGDLDAVLGNGNSSFGQQNRLYLNDGTAAFTDATAARMPADNEHTHAAALGDVDGDGDLDMILGNGGQQNRLYLNDGTAVFADATAARVPTDTDISQAVALGDVDADGDLDVVFGNGSLISGRQNRLLLNDGTGTHTDATAARMPTNRDETRSTALGDVDRDGDLDMVSGNEGEQNRLYLNDGNGNYADATAARMPVDSDFTHAVALGDVDNDGDLDMVFGNSGQNRLYLNDGNGTYADATAARMPPDRGATAAVALNDADGDGDLDMVLGNSGQNRLYLNDGNGNYADVTAARMPADNYPTQTAALGDVDGDGDLDVVFGNWEQPNQLYLNDGAATFTDVTASHMPAQRAITHTVALGDVDGDGDLDMVLANRARPNQLYFNDGTGTFTPATVARMPLYSDSTHDASLGDLDLDGDLDIVFGNDGVQNRLFLNDGTGTFTDVTASRMPADGDSTHALALGDVDDDGDLDIVSANDGQTRLYYNLRRQLDAPHLVRIGRHYTLEAYARYGPQSLLDAALPFLSTATASIPVPPFGTFRLEPTLLLTLPPFFIPQPAGVGSVGFVVPHVPGLVGASVHAQALLLHPPFQERLTGVTADVVIE